MFKFARSRPLASAIRAVQVDSIETRLGKSDTDCQQREAFRDPNIQQKRSLSIHEYLSANLLRDVGLDFNDGRECV